MTLFSLMKTTNSMSLDVVHHKAQFSVGDVLNHTNEPKKIEEEDGMVHVIPVVLDQTISDSDSL